MAFEVTVISTVLETKLVNQATDQATDQATGLVERFDLTQLEHINRDEAFMILGLLEKGQLSKRGGCSMHWECHFNIIFQE